MLESFVNGTIFEKALIVMLIGMSGVFIILLLFYFLIKALGKWPGKKERGLTDNDNEM